MHEHMSLRERIEALRKHGEPVFEASHDPILVSFGNLFAESELFSLDANKHLRTDALSPIYDCWTERRLSADDDPEKFVVIWTPVWERDDPVTGFRTGQDSVFVGSTPTVAMPQDERTAALLLLVSSTFVHLSASRTDGGLLIQGAQDGDENSYRFLTLDPSAVTVTDPASTA